MNETEYCIVFTNFHSSFAFAPGPSVLFWSFASQSYLFQISDKNLCKMEFYSYTLTITGFSKILYKNQITEQWKDTAKTKCTLTWESGGGMENYGKSSMPMSSKD